MFNSANDVFRPHMDADGKPLFEWSGSKGCAMGESHVLEAETTGQNNRADF